MADNKQDTQAPPAPQFNMQDFAAMIGGAVTNSLEAHDPKKESFGHYTKRVNAGKPTLTRQCFQNGFHLFAENMSVEQINLLNAINRTGRYINRKVEVIVAQDGADETVELRYLNKTSDHRQELRNEIRDFTDMLRQIVAAQKTENDAEEDRLLDKATDPRRPRHFGDTKAYRDAKAQAEA